MKRRIKSLRRLSIFLLLFLILFFILPNIFNRREREAFSDEERLNKARKGYSIHTLSDSVEVVPGEFYRRGKLIEALLGSAYRVLWQQKVKVPVLKLKELKGGLQPIAFSGRHQTIGIKVKDSSGQIWSLRSVNKDQSAALPDFLKSSILRPMFRDQACSMNPYGGLPVAKLASAINIHCDTPAFYFFPYDENLGKYNNRMAGRLVTLTRRWEDGAAGPNNSIRILATEEMLDMTRSKAIPIDTVLYLRTRLFDMLISDWDRHAGNWKWALKKERGRLEIEPLAIDRDMAFYRFGEGVINKVSRVFVNMFQSFNTQYDNMEGLMEQSKLLDHKILGKVKKEEFLRQAAFIQSRLNHQIIAAAFRTYPANIYPMIGKEHEVVLKKRLEKLPVAAANFYELVRVVANDAR